MAQAATQAGAWCGRTLQPAGSWAARLNPSAGKCMSSPAEWLVAGVRTAPHHAEHAHALCLTEPICLHPPSPLPSPLPSIPPPAPPTERLFIFMNGQEAQPPATLQPSPAAGPGTTARPVGSSTCTHPTQQRQHGKPVTRSSSTCTRPDISPSTKILPRPGTGCAMAPWLALNRRQESTADAASCKVHMRPTRMPPPRPALPWP